MASETYTRNALITGISKGIGKALALRFSKEGYRIHGVSRTAPDFPLDSWIQADLTQPADRMRIREEFLTQTDTLEVLINNAGRGLYSTWEDTSPEDLRAVFELNFFSLVELSRSLLPELKKTRGKLINISSVAGKFYVPCMGGYCSTKYALNAFSDSLRVELLPYGVHVLNCIVGRISTGFSISALGNRTPPHTPGSGSAEKLADAIYTAFRKNKREIVFPRWYLPFQLVVKTFPSLYDRLNLKKWNLSVQ